MTEDEKDKRYDELMDQARWGGSILAHIIIELEEELDKTAEVAEAWKEASILWKEVAEIK